MKELIHRLFPIPEVHRVSISRIDARCLNVTWFAGELQPKIASTENELAIVSAIKRLNMKAVAFESLSVFLSSCHLLPPQIGPVPIEPIDCTTVNAGHKLIIPSIFSIVSTWGINIFRADGIAPKRAAVQRLSPESHLDESTIARIESVLQVPDSSSLKVSTLAATLMKFDQHDEVKINARVQVIETKIDSAIQSWRDFPPPFKPKIINRINAVFPPVRCERSGISWRFLNEHGDECLDLNIHTPFAWFKLSDENLNRGRLAKKITDGIYLLVVPREWECLNVASSCFVFNEQELLSIDHWCGYLIRVDKSLTEFPSFKTSSGAKKICDRQKLLPSQRALSRLELQRLRWGIADEHSGTAGINWQKKSIEVEESSFAATSSEALWVDIPKTFHIDSVHAGFQPRKLRRLKGIFPIALREFYDAIDLHQNSNIFYLWIRDSRREHAVPALKIKTKAWHCKHADCSFVSSDWESIESHYRDVHPEYGFKALRYSEAQTRGLYGNEFPARIYQCGYNPQHFVDAATLAFNPTSAILHHIEHNCIEASAQTPGGRPQIRFSVVEDVEKIRANYLSNLPIWVKCLFCENFFKKSENSLEDGFFTHLMQMHQNKLFERK